MSGKEVFAYAGGSEVLIHQIHDYFVVVGLAAEHVKIDGTVFIGEMAADVAGLNQLYQGIAGFVARSKVDDLRLAVRNHVNVFYQLLGKGSDIFTAGHEIVVAASTIQDKMITPVGHFDSSTKDS